MDGDSNEPSCVKTSADIVKINFVSYVYKYGTGTEKASNVFSAHKHTAHVCLVQMPFVLYSLIMNNFSWV